MILDVFVNHEERTIHPAHPDGDALFGLNSGTNGTGPQWRRRAVELAHDLDGHGYVWRKYRGGNPEGLALIPPVDDSSWKNPWEGL